MTARYAALRASWGGPAAYICILLAALGGAAVTVDPLFVLLSLAALGLIWLGASTSPFRIVIATYLSFQWLQATGIVWIAAIYGIDLAVPQTVYISRSYQPFDIPAKAQLAILLALAAVIMVSLGARLVAPRLPPLRPAVAEFSARRLLIGYFGLLLVSIIAGPFIGGGLAQPIIVLGSLRLVFALLLLFGWVTRRQSVLPLLIVFATEIVVGFTGYFSNFKDIFIVLGTGLLMLRREYWARVAPPLVAGFVALVVLATVWTAVKGAYREILNQNTGTQTVQIGVEERLKSFVGLVGKLDARDLADGVVGLAIRVSYIQYLADVLAYVPEARPYERGALWGEAIILVLKPRILFPEKGVIANDSERTMRYTGRILASDEQGTSISIGYVGDSYIDFGFAGAVLVPFLLGSLYALIARHIIAASHGGDATIGVAVLVVIMALVQQFEISSIKLFPGVLWAWIVGSFAVWIVWPRVRWFFCTATVKPSRLQRDAHSLPGF